MQATSPNDSIPDLYPIKTDPNPDGAGLAGPTLRQITDAWQALEALATSLPQGPDRWQEDSLFVAREGMRQAWLALSNLDRRLNRKL